mgnify:CR=1 FL=1
MMIMEKLTQNILRLSISAALLTIPFSALFIGCEYLGYKRGISNYAEDLSSTYDQLLDKLKEKSPGIEY